MNIRRMATIFAAVAVLAVTLAPAAFAGGMTDQQRKEAAGWGCAEAVGLPAGHCIGPGTVKGWPAEIAARGGTFQLLVFDETGSFRTAEIATFKASAAERACPHDPESPDGSYWPFVPGLYVCHHQPE